MIRWFFMNCAPVAGSITWAIDQQTSALPLCYGCHQLIYSMTISYAKHTICLRFNLTSHKKNFWTLTKPCQTSRKICLKNSTCCIHIDRYIVKHLSISIDCPLYKPDTKFSPYLFGANSISVGTRKFSKFLNFWRGLKQGTENE